MEIWTFTTNIFLLTVFDTESYVASDASIGVWSEVHECVIEKKGHCVVFNFV